MYFIPRNNAFYHYIAHINITRRYCATLFILVGFGIACFYGIYAPLNAHILLYKAELARLQKQYEDTQQLKKSSQELSTIIDANKKNVSEYAIADDKRQELCGKRMQFVFDTIVQLGLTLSSYGSCKEKDKKWYVKDVAHCQIIGSLEKLLSFLKKIKDSDQMISLSYASLTRINDGAFQLSCDVGIVSVKK